MDVKPCSCVSALGHTSGCKCGCFDNHVCPEKKKPVRNPFLVKVAVNRYLPNRDVIEDIICRDIEHLSPIP